MIVMMFLLLSLNFFFFNDTATTEIYTLSLHDALPICPPGDHLRLGAVRDPLLPGRDAARGQGIRGTDEQGDGGEWRRESQDRKSTRLNSSHSQISYAVFCLKKKRACWIQSCLVDYRCR